MLAEGNEAAASDAWSHLVAVCLHRKQSQLPWLLADVIHAADTEAGKAAVSRLAATAECVQLSTHAMGPTPSRKVKDPNTDQAQQQLSAMAVLLNYASKGAAQLTVVLELFFCKVCAIRYIMQ